MSIKHITIIFVSFLAILLIVPLQFGKGLTEGKTDIRVLSHDIEDSENIVIGNRNETTFTTSTSSSATPCDEPEVIDPYGWIIAILFLMILIFLGVRFFEDILNRSINKDGY